MAELILYEKCPCGPELEQCNMEGREETDMREIEASEPTELGDPWSWRCDVQPSNCVLGNEVSA